MIFWIEQRGWGDVGAHPAGSPGLPDVFHIFSVGPLKRHTWFQFFHRIPPPTLPQKLTKKINKSEK